MDSYPFVLRDSDEIRQFFLGATGMEPGYVQLSRGLADLRIRVVELDGMTLIWTRARGRARWRDQMTGGGLHIGFAIESAGPVTVQGRDVGRHHGQVWMPGKEMDLVLEGPNLTLDIGVDAALVEELGWQVKGQPLEEVPAPPLSRFLRACSQVTDVIEGHRKRGYREPDVQGLRNQLLDDLEPVLEPWLTDNELPMTASWESPHFDLVRRTDDFFELVGIEQDFKVNKLVNWLDVPRRTLFHAFRKHLGVGPRRYLELKRLHALRAALRRASHTDDTVANIATNLGFSDLGRLAASYRHQFGEKPSETLRLG